jgi:glycine dehydrogenase
MLDRPCSVLEAADSFVSRHIAPSDKEIADMLRVVGADSLEALVGETVPASIRVKTNLALPRALDEAAVIAELRAMAARNGGAKSLIGQGYHGTHTPP